MPSNRIALFVLGFAALVAATGLAKDEWPQWRGPGGQGHAPDAENLPVQWSETKNVTWKTPIPGKGHSSPVISGGQIWLTSARETPTSEAEAKERLKVNTGDQPLVLLDRVSLRAICVDRDSGAIRHDIELLQIEDPQWVHALNSYATPTPVLKDGRLFCHFGSFGTVCLDTRSLEIAWKNTDSELRVMHENGPGSTPVVHGNRVIFHLDGTDRQFVAALDATTGKLAWTRDRSGEMAENPQHRKSYATPLIVEAGEGAQVVSPGADWLYGYDPESGRELWKMPYGQLGFSNVSRAVAGNGMLFQSTGFGRTEMQALRLNGADPPEIVWREKKGAPRMPSPILVGSELYFVSDTGIVSCLDAETGKVHWQERIGGNHSASPLFADGKLYFFSREGAANVIEPGTSFKSIGRNQLEGAHMASAAAVGSALFLRTDRALYRIEKPGS